MSYAENPLIQAIELCFSRNEERIFGPLDFHVHAGEALLVRGDNGAGKTTLLRVLAGLLVPESGQVLLNGEAFSHAAFVECAAYLGHKHGHKAELTVLQNLRFSAQLRGLGEDSILEQLIAECGLAGYEDTVAGKLSTGQNKRLSLARLKAQGSRLWLMDEPYANLDLAGIAWVNGLVQTHVANGGGALISSHGAYAAPEVPVRTLEIFRSTAHA
ncbi:MAG: heme ABC exporter ATP-binding protein CcmA [Arenimonas sp.]|nr:heme ABC exporter ATP-binding protein CcmA [Arenimonas sp.]MBP7916988.1 heme ABC exporter ATP-binding protein CcmA [Arenimonas sp.]